MTRLIESNKISSKVHMLRQKMFYVRHRLCDDFIFVHINKTAGSSIERALKIPFQHKTAVEFINDIGRSQWDNKVTFTVVRNPWDKVVSHYQYRLQTNQTALKTSPISFSHWVERAYEQRDPLYCDNPKMFMPQTHWITDAEGEVLVKKICRFENIAADFRELCKTLGRNVDLPHSKATSRDEYPKYYDMRTRDVVASFFQSDIKMFDYRF